MLKRKTVYNQAFTLNAHTAVTDYMRDTFLSGVNLANNTNHACDHAGNLFVETLANITLDITANYGIEFDYTGSTAGFRAYSGNASGSGVLAKVPAVGLTAILKMSCHSPMGVLYFGFANAAASVAADEALWLIPAYDDAGNWRPYIKYNTGTSEIAVLSGTPHMPRSYSVYTNQRFDLNLAVRVMAVSGNNITMGFFMQSPAMIGFQPGSPSWHLSAVRTITVADGSAACLSYRLYMVNGKNCKGALHEARFCLDPQGALLGLPRSMGCRRSIDIGPNPQTNGIVIDAPYVYDDVNQKDIVLLHSNTTDGGDNGSYKLHTRASGADYFTVGSYLWENDGTYTYQNAAMVRSGTTVLAVCEKTDDATNAVHDLVGKVSTDSGTTWGDEFTILDHTAAGYDPLMVVNGLIRTSSGRWLLTAYVTGTIYFWKTDEANPSTGWEQLTSQALSNGGETTLAELNGTLYAVARTGLSFAYIAKSVDGGANWTKPWTTGAGFDYMDGLSGRPEIPSAIAPVQLMFHRGKAYFFHVPRVSNPYNRRCAVCTVADDIEDPTTYSQHPLSPVHGGDSGSGGYSYWSLTAGPNGELRGTVPRRYQGADFLVLPNFFNMRQT